MSDVLCVRCQKRYGRGQTNHCPVCHETFTTFANGDKHRKGSGADRHCVDPAAAGLVLNVRGAWSMPGRPDETPEDAA